MRPFRQWIRTLVVVGLAAALAGGQTISSNPRLYREWMRRQTDKDLAGLYRSANEVARLLANGEGGDLKKAADEAEQIVKLAHDAWSNVQLRKPTRQRPAADPAWERRDLEASRKDALETRDLVREIAEGISTEQRAHELDANLRVSTLDKLEIVERFGLRLKLDLEKVGQSRERQRAGQ